MRLVTFDAHAGREKAITARADIIGTTSFPDGLWQQVWSNDRNKRLNQEIRRRTDSVGVSPYRDAITRLIGAVLAEQTDNGPKAAATSTSTSS